MLQIMLFFINAKAYFTGNKLLIKRLIVFAVIK